MEVAPRKDFMPARTRSKTASAKRSNKVRLVKGRLKLKVVGYSGLQTLSPSQLVRHIPASKLRLAARKVLKLEGRSRNKRKKGKSQKRKVGNKRQKGASKKSKRRKQRKGRRARAA